MKLLRSIFFICALIAGETVLATESWETALSQMPLAQPATELGRTNCVPLMLNSFQSNSVVKALIFMPGATDELYFFRRAHAQLTNANPSLLDAVVALTNQTFIEATFQPPLLILHTTEDSLNVIAIVKNKSTEKKLRRRVISERILLNDADWGEAQSELQKHLSVWLRPSDAANSWHFYRHSFVACGLTQWQMLKALALAGKTTFTLHWLTADFQPDQRHSQPPKLKKFPN